jgi:type IX secretion system PorP/SprF family membrane protein
MKSAKMIKQSILTIVLVFCFNHLLAVSVSGQNFQQSRQFYFSPQLFNVAYLGDDNKTNVLLFYRKQWLDIEDAPVNYGFNVQYPTKKNLALGFTYSSLEIVSLRTDGLLASLVYKLPISENQSIRFGLSGGATFYKLDLENADYSNDPAVLNLMAGSSYPSGNFGFLYTLRKIKLGVTLPELIGKNYLTKSGKYTQLLNQLYSISTNYKFKSWSDDYYITNYFLYRLSYDYQNNWELGGVVSMKDLLKVGLSYRQNGGLGFLMGIRALSMFGFSYSFESKPIASEFTSSYSHELHLDLIINDFIKMAAKNSENTSPIQ